MKKISLIAGLVFTIAFQARAQIEMGLVASPSMSTFHGGEQDISDSYTFPINYGLKVNYRYKKFMFSSGLLHIGFGKKYQFAKTSANNPDGMGELFDVFYRIKSFVIPVNAEYIFFEKNKSAFFGGLGIYTGYIYSQEEEDTSIPENWQPDPAVSYPYPVGRHRDVAIFDEYYFALNIGLGWRQEFTDEFSLQVKPNFLYHLRQEQSRKTHRWTNRMMSWALDIGIYYRLK